MAATTPSDEEKESLIRAFEQISQGYKDALAEIQSLRLSYSSETRRCEALETMCNDLQIDNERLRRLYTETLFKFTSQMKCHIEAQSLKGEVEKANCRLLNLEEEHKRTIEILNQENESKIHDIANQLSRSLLQRQADDATIKQLQLDLASHKSHIATLSEKLGEVTADVDSKYHQEIQDLKDWIVVEQEEKNELHRKLQNAENELKLMKNKQVEQLKDSVSIHHVETLKQKIMKLRKENESLKRRLLASEFGDAGN